MGDISTFVSLTSCPPPLTLNFLQTYESYVLVFSMFFCSVRLSKSVQERGRSCCRVVNVVSHHCHHHPPHWRKNRWKYVGVGNQIWVLQPIIDPNQNATAQSSHEQTHEHAMRTILMW